MINVKGNFSSKYEDLSCDLCDQNEPQTQEHLLDCPVMIDNCPKLFNNRSIGYTDVFKGPTKQLRCTQIFASILDTKQKIEEKEDT